MADTCMNNASCSNFTTAVPDQEFGYRDAVWVVTTSIMIFQMQTGFGLLESGCVRMRSETNIMVKNALDVVFGGITYWAFGFGLSYGEDPGTNPFVGHGYYALQNIPAGKIGYIYAVFLFQLSFATTSCTIVSGALAERINLYAYNAFSMCMTLIYCFPAHWMWAGNGFLATMGVQDIAGCGPVHLVGGVTGIVGTYLIGPRIGIFDSDYRTPPPSAVKAILGTFMLWWGWLRFNSGSVFIVSNENAWTYSVTAAMNTILASIGGGLVAVCMSLIMHYGVPGKKYKGWFPYDVPTMINGILGSLVSITAACTMVEPWESIIIGAIGAALTMPTEHFIGWLKIDDPVGVAPVHVACAIWGLLAVGLFIPESLSTYPGQGGLFKTGQFYLLGVQLMSVVVITAWSIVMALFFFKVIDKLLGLRLSPSHEEMGADMCEHGMGFTEEMMKASLYDPSVTHENIENVAADKFYKRVNLWMDDLLRSVRRNNLYISLQQDEDSKVILAISNLEHAGMCGVETVAAENTSKTDTSQRDTRSLSMAKAIRLGPDCIEVDTADGETERGTLSLDKTPKNNCF